jgi:hypothetical protein
MKEEIFKILTRVQNRELPINEAQDQLLRLFDVSGSCSVDELEEMKRLAHEGLPSDCVAGWDEVKFCHFRQSDGNMCKWCSNYR